MKTVALAIGLTLTLTQNTFATSLNDVIDTPYPTCFRQEYSESHLKSNPQQSVRAMGLNIYTEDNAAKTIHLQLQTEVLRNGTLKDFTTYMICDRDGESLSCAVECDGGQARVTATANGLELAHDGFVLQEACEGEAAPEAWLDPANAGDDRFDLEEVDCSN